MIYFIQLEKGGPIHINHAGTEALLKVRMKDVLQGAAQTPLFFKVVGGNHWDLRDIKQTFARNYTHGDWYRLDDALREYVNEVADTERSRPKLSYNFFDDMQAFAESIIAAKQKGAV